MPLCDCAAVLWGYLHQTSQTFAFPFFVPNVFVQRVKKRRYFSPKENFEEYGLVPQVLCQMTILLGHCYEQRLTLSTNGLSPPFSPTVLTCTDWHLEFHLSSLLVIDFRMCCSASFLAPCCEKTPAETYTLMVNRRQHYTCPIRKNSSSFDFFSPLLRVCISLCGSSAQLFLT